MAEGKPAARSFGFVVLRQDGPDTWTLLGEFERRPGLTAGARAGEVYAAVRSDWRVGLDRQPPTG